MAGGPEQCSICLEALDGGVTALAGGHLLRVIEVFDGPEAFPFPAATLRWHPLGRWLLCCHNISYKCDSAAGKSGP